MDPYDLDDAFDIHDFDFDEEDEEEVAVGMYDDQDVQEYHETEVADWPEALLEEAKEEGDEDLESLDSLVSHESVTSGRITLSIGENALGMLSMPEQQVGQAAAAGQADAAAT